MNTGISLVSALIFILSGCAVLQQHDPLRITLAGIEPLEGKGMEARFAVQLRVQNHTSTPFDYDGIAVDLDVRGKTFASGVSDKRGTVPRFGETVITVPVSVPATAILHQAFELARGDLTKPKADYRLRGLLGGPGLGRGQRFEAEGELNLPAAGSAETRRIP
ncbi:MAG: LEA type 2 family protein [Nitrosospira sp.]|nr:LEA type 2 family protein [Nitrosospira sp.]